MHEFVFSFCCSLLFFFFFNHSVSNPMSPDSYRLLVGTGEVIVQNSPRDTLNPTRCFCFNRKHPKAANTTAGKSKRRWNRDIKRLRDTSNEWQNPPGNLEALHTDHQDLPEVRSLRSQLPWPMSLRLHSVIEL